MISTSVFGGGNVFPKRSCEIHRKWQRKHAYLCRTCRLCFSEFAGSSGVNISGCDAQNITHAQTVRLVQ